MRNKIICVAAIFIIAIILSYIAMEVLLKRNVSIQNTVGSNIKIDSNHSCFFHFEVEGDIVKLKCRLSLNNQGDQTVTFYIRAKSPEDVGTLLKDENLRILENGKEKVFQLNAYEKKEIDVFFEGEYGGSNLKKNRLLPSQIEIVYTNSE